MSFNRFAAFIDVDLSPIASRPSSPVAAMPLSPVITGWDAETSTALQVAQSSYAAQCLALDQDLVSWGDLMWATEFVEEQRKPLSERRRYEPVQAAPPPVSFREWDNEDSDDEPEWVRGAKGMIEHEIHLGPDGLPEECRFFNTAAGCRSGEKCPYQHIKRAQQEIECRFFKMPRGCRSGAACIYKHC
jgi:hypothetical protein